MSPFHLEHLTDAPVVDRDGQHLGKVADVYLDQLTGRPGWLLVQTDLLGQGEAFVPLDRAIAHEDAIQVPYSKDQVQDAPKVDPDAELSLDEQDRLYEHYDRAFAAGRSGAGVDEDSADAGQAGQPAAGGDDAMTALEEKLRQGAAGHTCGDLVEVDADPEVADRVTPGHGVGWGDQE